jgi:hypothetical protein
MYLQNDGFSGYDRDGEQIRQRGLFLLFCQPPGVAGASAPIKCLVRKVAMRQCGQWMMGRANIGGHWYTVSGAYGGDGLPISVPQEVYDRLAITLPADLYEAWNNGEGWNSAGSEARAVRKWALENLDALRK